ncbi:MAG: RNA methyltransferase [Berryella intestinalis]|uniref:TrmH family RNA methyltransferase n=1 Tax=Berryella intestinalis TaxID=1531429 RepID=UPI002A5511E3|nr:RNA methyltransferase [Berryella intestinalis]MDD7368800.1 RNA methyltransferase [Berryella intestinalis]MDY3128916.1 RNA methyltransferase [Berryella intestinalis]
MPLVSIDRLTDPRLDPFARLTDVALRSRIEPEKGVFIAETVEVIGRALDAGCVPLSLLTAPEYLGQLEAVIGRIEREHPDVPVFAAPCSELRQLTGFELTRGALCAFRRPALESVEKTLENARVVAVLEDIRNHTNVGAIFRSAAAIGADAVLVSPACYDPLYRRAVRVSMGAVFQVPWTRMEGDPRTWFVDGSRTLRELGFTIAAMALEDDSIPLDDPRVRAQDRIALVFGTEGYGLSRTTLERCDMTVRIPMRHGVDSLNVAASSAVAFWELVRETA